MSRLNNKYGKQSKKVKFSKKNFDFFSIRTFGTDNITPTIPTLMPIIRRENTVLQLANMVGVTRVGRGAISQILHSPKEGDLTGQESCTAVPKSLPNPPRTGSKTERHGVQKEEDESLPLFSFTLRRGRCSCGGSADLSALCKCAVLLRNIRILIENLLFK